MKEQGSTAPAAIVAVDHDEASIERLRNTLQGRFGADYEIVAQRSPRAALASLP